MPHFRTLCLRAMAEFAEERANKREWADDPWSTRAMMDAKKAFEAAGPAHAGNPGPSTSGAPGRANPGRAPTQADEQERVFFCTADHFSSYSSFKAAILPYTGPSHSGNPGPPGRANPGRDNPVMDAKKANEAWVEAAGPSHPGPSTPGRNNPGRNDLGRNNGPSNLGRANCQPPTRIHRLQV